MRFTSIAASIFALAITAVLPVYAEQTPQAAAQSAEQQEKTITVNDAWSRELPPTAPVGAAFLHIENHSALPDRLISANSSIAEVTELHAHIHEGDVMRMVKVEAIDIPAHSQLTLEPGGYHIMLIDLQKPLVAGEQLPLTLQFEQAGTIDLIVEIKNSDAGTSAEQQHMDHAEHSHH